MSENTHPPVLTEVDGATLVVTLDRPRVRNAIDGEVAGLVAEAMQRLDDDPALRVGVVTGAGGTFCSGMDLKGFGRGELPVHPERGFAGLTTRPPRKPLIAAVEGYALAGGFEIVLACDLVVAGRGATFGIPEVRRGLVAGAGGLLRLPQRIPRNIAMELAMVGGHVDAPRMAELGLVNRLVDDGEALRAALTLAAEIAANGPLAVAATKQILTESPDWTGADAWARQDVITTPVTESADAREGAAAFTERRTPVWLGR